MWRFELHISTLLRRVSSAARKRLEELSIVVPATDSSVSRNSKWKIFVCRKSRARFPSRTHSPFRQDRSSDAMPASQIKSTDNKTGNVNGLCKSSSGLWASFQRYSNYVHKTSCYSPRPQLLWARIFNEKEAKQTAKRKGLFWRMFFWRKVNKHSVTTIWRAEAYRRQFVYVCELTTWGIIWVIMAASSCWQCSWVVSRFVQFQTQSWRILQINPSSRKPVDHVSMSHVSRSISKPFPRLMTLN